MKFLSKIFILSLILGGMTQCHGNSRDQEGTKKETAIKAKVNLHKSEVDEPIVDSASVPLTASESTKTPESDVPPHTTPSTKSTSSNSKRVAEQENQHVSQKQNLHKVYIDEEGYTVKDGKRIFPFGVYMGSAGSTDNTNLKRISDAGFNTILCYGYGTGKDQGRYLERAKNHGLNVVYSLKGMYPSKTGGNMEYFLKHATDQINRLKNYDALLAWYINDEMGPAWIPLIKRMYDTVKENDPDHPTFQVLYQEDILARYRDITDIFAMDSYNIGAKDLTQSSKRAKLSINSMRNSNLQNKKGVWQVPQMYDKSVYDETRESRAPSSAEMKNQAYQAIIHGAKGIIFYSYFDLFKEKNPKTKKIDEEHFNKRWEDVIHMSKEISSIIPILVNGNEVRVDIQKKSFDEGGVLAIEFKGALYLFLANPYYDEQSISITIPQNYVMVEKMQSQITGTLQGNTLVLTLPTLASGVFKLQNK